MQTIIEIENALDKIDDQIIDLIKNRKLISKQYGEEKTRLNLPIKNLLFYQSKVKKYQGKLGYLGSEIFFIIHNDCLRIQEDI